MYARFLIARYGAAAGETAREKAKALQRQGDRNGHDVWNAVADVIERIHGARKGQPAVAGA